MLPALQDSAKRKFTTWEVIHIDSNHTTSKAAATARKQQFTFVRLEQLEEKRTVQ